jgi:glucose-1-phosphate thymidylyltransferase
MAGMGKRMRPHTLTVPKPLLPIAGKPIVQRLVEDIADIIDEKIDTVGFIVNPKFGPEVEASLIQIAENIGSTGKIYYQTEALGTAHAIISAEELLDGHVVVAFADTLFRADFTLDPNRDGIIWVQKVDDPTAFGVVKMDDDGVITDFVEKPDTFVSDLAIIGIYYFKNGDILKDEIHYVIDNDIKDKGEYQLTSALENMKQKGAKFTPGQVKEWLDCGNKNVTVATNSRYLEFIKDQNLVSDSAQVTNSVIIPPVYLGDNVRIVDSVIGPNVSIGDESEISRSMVKDSLIQTNSTIRNAHLSNSMLGNFVNFEGSSDDLSLGDFSEIKK